MIGSEVKKHLFSLTHKGIKYDLERIIDSADCLGNPQYAFKCFHVAGTNGKGSTCSFLESILRKSGFRTGLYTSPHILHFEERIRINGIPVREQQWLSVYEDIHLLIEQKNLTFFEASTLIAFELFRRENVDWVVVETGLGGRLDATNIVMPQVSIITRIAMDHTDLLGNTLLSIAREKFGIIKRCTPVVCAANPDQAVMRLFNETCVNIAAPCRVIEVKDDNRVRQCDDGIWFIRHNQEFRVGMQGTFQAGNALLALEAIELAGLYNVNTCVSGLAQTFVPCRFQRVQYSGKTFILDVGHNPDAAAVLVENIKRVYPGKTIGIVTGIMKDKDFAGVIFRYLQVASMIFLSRPRVERAATVDALLDAVPPDYKGRCRVFPSVADSIDASVNSSFEIICVSGSFFTVGEACEKMMISPELGMCN